MNELAKVEAGVPAYLQSQGGKTGFETVSSDMLMMPFLKVAQALTQDVGKNGLSLGDFYVSTTKKSYGDTIKVVILGVDRRWNEWEGEGSNSVVVASYDEKEFEAIRPKLHKDDKGRDKDDKGHEYIDTRNIFVVIPDDPDAGAVCFPMAKTLIGVSRRLITQAMNCRFKDVNGRPCQAPMWSHVWELKTGEKKNDKGNYRTVESIKDAGYVPEPLVEAVREAFEHVQETIIAKKAVTDAAEGEPFHDQF